MFGYGGNATYFPHRGEGKSGKKATTATYAAALTDRLLG